MVPGWAMVAAKACVVSSFWVASSNAAIGAAAAKDGAAAGMARV